MVPVVHENIEKGHHRIEDPALNAQRLHLPEKLPTDEAEGAHIVIEKPHLYPVGSPLRQDFRKLPEGLPVLNGVILHENEAFRPPKRRLLGLQSLGRLRKIAHRRILIDRKARRIPEEVRLIRGADIVLTQMLQGLGILPQQGKEGAIDGLKAPSHGANKVGARAEKIKGQSEQGCRHDEDDPAQLDGGVAVLSEEAQHHKNRQDMHQGGQNGIVPVELQQRHQKPEHLQQAGNAGKKHPAHAVFHILLITLLQFLTSFAAVHSGARRPQSQSSARPAPEDEGNAGRPPLPRCPRS